MRWVTIDGLKSMLARAPRPELEQAGLRLAISMVVLGYLTWYAIRTRHAEQMSEVLSVAVIFSLFASILLVRIMANPDGSRARRFLGMVIDNAVTSYCLIRTDEGGAVILGVYLFVTFGNGFRYGRTYLHISQVMGLVGFSLVLMYSPYWSQHLPIGIGFLVAMVVLPFYVGVLAERINEARKRADDANKAKGRFLANISHEMRTPLNGVLAMADVLRETPLNESQREIVDTLGTSANLLLAQIEDVLDMAKIDAGRIQVESRPFDLGALVTATVKVMLPQARYKGLEVIMDIAPRLARWFIGDAHHLRQVLLNLLANAVKFTEHGQVSLHVSSASEDEAGCLVRFEVRDTGIGIPAAKQAAIFEPFIQADDSITRTYGGTGLGTTIARQLVTLMGGQIGLDSTVGVGTVFWVELRLQYGEPAGIDLTEELGHLQRLAPLPAKVRKIRGARVLVAEDNATNQRVTQMVLESAGHRPTIVDNGERALDELEGGGYDIALFDLAMPIVSGLQALKLYRFSTPRPIPILILSANVTTEIITECQQAGAAEFLPKPLRAGVLLAAIETHLSSLTVPQGTTTSPPESARPPRSEERPNLVIVESPAVDPTVLADLDKLSSDPTFVERLVMGFRSDVERIVKDLTEHLAGRRYEAVKNDAHALLGCASSVGATQLAQVAARINKASHDLLRSKGALWAEELTAAKDIALGILERHVQEATRKNRN